MDHHNNGGNMNGYNKFMCWRTAWNINSFSEDVFVEFFRQAVKIFPPISLPVIFTTLKNGMQSIHDVNIARFASLKDLLSEIGPWDTWLQRNQAVTGPTIAFSNDEICKFLTKAPDFQYLAIKTAVVICMHVKYPLTIIKLIRVNMVTDSGTAIVVRLPPKRADKEPKVYSISGEFAVIVRKYLGLRLRAQKEMKTEFFFVQYRQGKCYPGKMGKQTIRHIPPKIAAFLKLDTSRYDTQSFRMISPQLVDRGFQTNEYNRSVIPTYTDTGSVASSSNVYIRNAHDTGRSFRDADPFHDVSNVDTDDEISLPNDEEFSKAGNEGSVARINQSAGGIIANICAETQQQQQNRQLQLNQNLVDPTTSSSPNGMVANTDAGISDKIANSVPMAIHRMLQSKVDEQAKEIVRLKQLVEKKCVEIEVLKDLLIESMPAKCSTVTG